MEMEPEMTEQTTEKNNTYQTTQDTKNKSTIEILPLNIKAGEWDSSPPVPPHKYKPRSSEVKKDWTPKT